MKELKTQRNKSKTGKYLPQAQLKKLLQFVKKKLTLPEKGALDLNSGRCLRTYDPAKMDMVGGS